MKIFFLIRSLYPGGAERQLYNLCRELRKKKISITIITFYKGGSIENDFKNIKIQVICLEKKNRWDNLTPFIRLLIYVIKNKPDILHSYLQTSNILSALIKLFYRKLKVVWGVRISSMDFKGYDTFSKLINIIEKKLSKIPDFIIVNSNDAKNQYISNYKVNINKISKIDNGIDINKFYPINDKYLKNKLKNKYNKNIIIGMVARLDPMKDHKTFFNAIKIILEKRNDIYFICVGSGKKEYKESLLKETFYLNIDKNIEFIDTINDMNSFYNQIDILTLTSKFGEGFSNSISEALACNKPCVVSNIGESAKIVGSSSFVFEKGNYFELAKIWEKIINFKSFESRQRIISEYSIEEMVNKTYNIFKLTQSKKN